MYGTIPKDILAEILLFLAEKESFDSLEQLGTISPKKFKNALLALAKDLKAQSENLQNADLEKLTQELKKPFQEIIAQLPEQERERLIKGFTS